MKSSAGMASHNLLRKGSVVDADGGCNDLAQSFPVLLVC